MSGEPRRAHIGEGKGNIPVLVFADANALGEHLAADLLTEIAEKDVFLLGCPGGRSLRSTYRAMGRLAAQDSADLSRLVIVMMDDYVLPQGEGHAYCPADAHYSCRRFAREEIQGALNEGLDTGQRIPDKNVWLPDPANPGEYDERLTAAGGIDAFLLASGASDGHVAFNPPGSALECGTRIVPLPDSTRRDNLATFPEFEDLSQVPAHGVTVGLGTISALSRRALMAIHGAGKEEAVRRLADCGGFDAAWPASLLYNCPGPMLLLDEAAAAGLEARE